MLYPDLLRRYWRSNLGKDFARRFMHVGQVLKYLKQCAISVQLDLNRRQQRERLWLASEDERHGQHDASAEEIALDQVASQQHRAQVETRLQNDQERLVVYLSFELGLFPSEIIRLHPQDFADVEDVRRIKERVVKRLKGESELRAWLE